MEWTGTDTRYTSTSQMSRELDRYCEFVLDFVREV